MDDLESGSEMDVSVAGGTKRSSSTMPPVERTTSPSENGDLRSLLMLHVATAGKQDEDSGTDEYPIVLITAKRVDLDFLERDHGEFQCMVRPCMPILQRLNQTSGQHSNEETEESLGDNIDDMSAHEGALQEDVGKLEEANRVYANVVLSLDCRESTGLDDSMLSDAPMLADALEQLRTWITNQDMIVYDSQSNISSKTDGQEASIPRTTEDTIQGLSHQTKKARQERSFLIVTDGPSCLRSVLHQEAKINDIDLSNQPYFYQYIDLRKLFKRVYSVVADVSLTQMIEAAGINRYSLIDQSITTGGNETPNQSTESLEDHLSSSVFNNRLIPLAINVPSNSEGSDEGFETVCKPGYAAIEHCRMMAALTIHLHKHGVAMDRVEKISKSYQPAIVRKSEVVEDNTVVRARGLPWQATDLDIFNFFSGLNIADGGISLVLSKVGRRNGEALIRFEDKEQRQLALKRHKHHMGQRYIEVYAALGRDFIAYAGAETLEAEQFLERFTSPYQAVIRMRGLPYNANAEQILQFFESNQCPVQFGEQGVLFVNRSDGRATGDAFVLFESQTTAERALLNHRKHIGNRYIELFKSTPAEVNQVMNSASMPSTQTSTWPGLPMDPEAVLAFATLINNGLLGSVIKEPIDLRCRFPNFSQTQAFDSTTSLIGPFTNNPQSSNLLFPPILPSGPPILQPNLDSTMYNSDLLGSGASIPCNPALFLPNSTLFNDPQLSTMNSSPLAILRNPLSLYPQSHPISTPQWPVKLTAGGLTTLPNGHLSLEQMVRCYVRIRGMPTDADIMDILVFLDENWQNVALHGVHQVYESMGQPTGEAIIQFISEIVAQTVVELKNGTLFIKRGVSMHTSCYVEVTHCTVEDIRQLLNTLMTFCQTGAVGQLQSPIYPLTGLPQVSIKAMPFSATGNAIVQQPIVTNPAIFTGASSLSNLVLTRTGRPDLLTNGPMKANTTVSVASAGLTCPTVIPVPMNTNQPQNLATSFLQNGHLNSSYGLEQSCKTARPGLTALGHGTPCFITSTAPVKCDLNGLTSDEQIITDIRAQDSTSDDLSRAGNPNQ